MPHDEIHPPDLKRPPFCLQPDQTLASVTEGFLDAFDAFRRQPRKVGIAFEALAQSIAADRSSPLVCAGTELARLIDSGTGAGDGNAYHNAQHFCEVMLSSHFLALLAGLDPSLRAEVLLAALIHDFHHDGSADRETRFRLERLAFARALPELERAGVARDLQQRIGALLLATEASVGAKFTHGCHAHHSQGLPLPAIPAPAPELALLTRDASAALQALILCEADILPSVGLSIEYALQLQQNLAEEWNTPMGLDDKLKFINQGFAGFTVGALFRPNVERLRQYLMERQSPLRG